MDLQRYFAIIVHPTIGGNQLLNNCDFCVVIYKRRVMESSGNIIANSSYIIQPYSCPIVNICYRFGAFLPINF